jgi:hypothetical protein
MLKSAITITALAFAAVTLAACSETGTVSGPVARLDVQTNPEAGQTALVIQGNNCNIYVGSYHSGGTNIDVTDMTQSISASGNSTITCHGTVDSPPTSAVKLTPSVCYVYERSDPNGIVPLSGVLGTGENVVTPSGKVTAKCSTKKGAQK